LAIFLLPFCGFFFGRFRNFRGSLPFGRCSRGRGAGFDLEGFDLLRREIQWDFLRGAAFLLDDEEVITRNRENDSDAKHCDNNDRNFQEGRLHMFTSPETLQVNRQNPRVIMGFSVFRCGFLKMHYLIKSVFRMNGSDFGGLADLPSAEGTIRAPSPKSEI
jgi:hypothetical protein